MMEQTSPDPVRIATAIGHGAAANVLAAIAGNPADGTGDPTLDIACWPSLGLVRREDEARDPAGELGAYVCARPAGPGALPGETLFRKAAELGLHGAAADSWAAQPRHVRLAYELFSTVTAIAHRRLLDDAAAAAPAGPAPATADPLLTERIFDDQPESLVARDEIAAPAAALTSAATARSRRKKPAPAEPPAEAAGELMSVGERAVDTSRGAKAHGGKRTSAQ